MPTPTYTPLANITLGSTAATVTFSSISQSYRDLVLVFSVNAAAQMTYVLARLNSDSGSNYSFVQAYGYSGGAASDTNTLTGVNLAYHATPLTEMFVTANFMDYSVTDKHKTVLVRTTKADQETSMKAVRWANTAAITSIALSPTASSFAAGSTFALYGIAS